MNTPPTAPVTCPINCSCHTMTVDQLALYECDNVEEPSFSGPNSCCPHARGPLPGKEQVVGDSALITLGQLAASED